MAIIPERPPAAGSVQFRHQRNQTQHGGAVALGDGRVESRDGGVVGGGGGGVGVVAPRGRPRALGEGEIVPHVHQQEADL
eukprot:scaffold35458_cov84-Isochrysis_galbana.AAC.1